ncbi:hypothetical protein ACCC96_25505 [Pseudomonas sp. Pseusp11]|uniref:hypothetical protein n=1 Tax=Pseudomonas sp. Pseusp11 TaxID=3243003 RepID=UPI0039B3FAB6
MDVNGIVSMLGGKTLSKEQVESVKSQRSAVKLRDREVKAKVAELLTLMSTNNINDAKALARSLIILSSEKSLPEMRSVGVFRSSKYNFKTSTAKAVAQDCIANSDLLGLNPDQTGYFTSVKHLLDLGSKSRQINDGLIQVVKSRKKFIIKTLLANMEIMFATRFSGFDKNASSNSVEHYSNEDLAEAFSYILKLHKNEFGVINEHFQNVDESATSTELYWCLLIDAAKICQYKDAELLLDGFPYRATQDFEELVIESIDPRLEQSVRLGYMQTVQQMISRRVGLEQHVFNEQNSCRPASIKKFAEEFYEAGKGQIIFVNPEPIPRYVLGYAMVPELFEPFSTNDLFEEEIEALVQLGLENYDYGALKDVDIRDGISVLDIMKVQRLFRFVSVIYQLALADHEENDRYAIALRSVLPTFSEDLLGQCLKLVLPNRDYKKVLDLISLDLSNADHIDIQYTPLVKLNGYYVTAPAIIANSNLARNIFCGHRIKHPFVGDTDPMQSMLAEALKLQGFSVAQEINISFQKKEMETDIVAFKDGLLFLIECKNPYHPCNVHEMRNSYDHVSYGSHQLDVRKNWLSSVDEQKRLFAAAGFTYESVKEIHTCIAVANRVFNGYITNGHPVRQGHELINMIKSGVVNFAGVARQVWTTNEFNVEDLTSYLCGETTIKDCIESLVNVNVKYALKDKTLSFSTYFLDTERLSEVSKRYPEIA